MPKRQREDSRSSSSSSTSTSETTSESTTSSSESRSTTRSNSATGYDSRSEMYSKIAHEGSSESDDEVEDEDSLDDAPADPDTVMQLYRSLHNAYTRGKFSDAAKIQSALANLDYPITDAVIAPGNESLQAIFSYQGLPTIQGQSIESLLNKLAITYSLNPVDSDGHSKKKILHGHLKKISDIVNIARQKAILTSMRALKEIQPKNIDEIHQIARRKALIECVLNNNLDSPKISDAQLKIKIAHLEKTSEFAQVYNRHLKSEIENQNLLHARAYQTLFEKALKGEIGKLESQYKESIDFITREFKKMALTEEMKPAVAFTGIYTKKDLETYFPKIANLTTKEPIGLTLSNAEHHITVGYNPTSKRWTITDSKAMSVKKIKPDEIAELIFSAFNNDDNYTKPAIALSTKVHIKSESSLTNIKETLQKNLESLHQYDEKRVDKYDYGSRKMRLMDSHHTTWLAIACQYGDLKTVADLLAMKAHLQIPPEHVKSSLFLAAENGHREIVELLLTKLSSNYKRRTSDNMTPLHLAAQNGHLEVVKALLARTSPTTRNDITSSLPTKVHLKSEHGPVIGALYHSNMNVNSPMIDGTTPLHLAIEKQHIDVIKCLIENGANINAQLEDGTTPLQLAIKTKQLDVVELLQKNGAIFDKDDTALLNSYMQLHEYAKKIKSVINPKDGSTLLHNAIRECNMEEVERLLRLGANASAKLTDSAQTSMLELALNSDAPTKILRLLGQYGNLEAQAFYKKIENGEVKIGQAVREVAPLLVKVSQVSTFFSHSRTKEPDKSSLSSDPRNKLK